MSFPILFYALLKGGSYLTVKNALSETMEDIINTDQTNYRDTLDAAWLGRNVGADPLLDVATGAGPTLSYLVDPVFGRSLFGPANGPLTYTAKTNPETFAAKSDEYLHVAPRYEFHSRTMLRWWDIANYVPGNAYTFAASTVISSDILTLTAGSTFNLHPGQAISDGGSRIPANTTIRAIISSTTLAMSALGISTNTTTATVAAGTGGNPVGECWLDRFIGWSEEPPMRS